MRVSPMSLTKNIAKKDKYTIYGTANSEVRALRAISKPFSFYVGQWDMRVNTEKLKQYISLFAKVINIAELSTNLPNRHFRSFKVTVEAYSADAMLTTTNWPGGIAVSRWFERGRKRGQNDPNYLITSAVCLDKRINNSINNQNANRDLTSDPNKDETEDLVNLNENPSNVNEDSEENVPTDTMEYNEGNQVARTSDADNSDQAESI